jgi:hypothetical protein
MNSLVDFNTTSETGRLDNYALDDLVSMRGVSQAAIDHAKAEIAAIDTEYTRRFGPTLQDVLDNTGKQSTSHEIEGGFKAKGSISKTVTWDSDILQTVAATLDWEMIQHYFKIKFSIAEAIFKAVPPGKLKDTFALARTVKYGDLKVAVDPAS